MTSSAKKKPYAMYETVPDEEIVEYARGGSEVALEYLINKYKNFVRAKARPYFLIGADREDIIQEGMIGLYKAIRDFRVEKLTSFRAFAGAVYHSPNHYSHKNSNKAKAHSAELICFSK